MAAGDGRRLRPLTERWPKPVLPIDGRPVIVTLLHELADAGFRAVWVVTGHLAEQVEGLVAGCEPRLELRFIRQPRPDGSADAVRCALAAGAQAPVLVSAADTVYRPGDLRRLDGEEPAIAWRRGGRGAALRVEEGRVLQVPADDPGNDQRAAPLWLLTDAVAPLLVDLPGPPFELSAAYQRAIDAGTRVRAIEIGPTRDLTEPADVVLHNFPYLESEA